MVNIYKRAVCFKDIFVGLVRKAISTFFKSEKNLCLTLILNRSTGFNE